MKPLIAIYGPTHTGKTDLAKDLYSKLPSELISVDSVQIYKGFDIGSNKPEKKELQKLFQEKEIKYKKLNYLE